MNRNKTLTRAIPLLLCSAVLLSACAAEPGAPVAYDGYGYDPIYGSVDFDYGGWGGWHHDGGHFHAGHGGGFAQHAGFGGHGIGGGHRG